MLLVRNKKRMAGPALRSLSVGAMKLTVDDATEQANMGVIELPAQIPLPELNMRLLRQVATDVLGAYDTYGPKDIAYAWVLGAGLQESAAIAGGGDLMTDPVATEINHRYWIRFTMEVLSAARPGDDDAIARAFEPMLSWDKPVLDWDQG